MINRRAFLKFAGMAALMPWGCVPYRPGSAGVLLNDVHSGLNQTRVREVIAVRSVYDIQRAVERAAAAFRRLIDLARKRGGSYFLTYHKWAAREQVQACYPQFPEFLRLKRRFDPEERFQSDWYRHYRTMFADIL
jgi:hypothetical protein